MASRGLPGKPMVDVNGLPLLLHVWRHAVGTKLGEVLVAASENETAQIVRKAGGEAIIVPGNLATHIDRCGAALALRDEKQVYKTVIILPADMPLIDANDLRRCLGGLTNETVDISMLAAPLAEATREHVKVLAPLSDEREVAYVRDLNRDTDDPAPWQYAGITAYRRTVLDRLSTTSPTQSEQLRGIEQMRALDLGYKIAAVSIAEIPFRVRSKSALDHARQILKGAK